MHICNINFKNSFFLIYTIEDGHPHGRDVKIKTRKFWQVWSKSYILTVKQNIISIYELIHTKKILEKKTYVPAVAGRKYFFRCLA